MQLLYSVRIIQVYCDVFLFLGIGSYLSLAQRVGSASVFALCNPACSMI